MNRKKSENSESRRTFTIILSIVVALFLWAYVIGEVNPTTEQTIPNVPVQLLNIQSLNARELAIVGDGEYTVDVVVEGKRTDIMNVTAEEIIAEADLFGWSKGENFIPVRVNIPDPFKLIEVKSGKIEVTIEDLVALSKPVEVIYRGEMPRNTEEGAVVIKPSEIEVTGARSEVETVTRIQVTINIDNLSADGETVQGTAVPVNHAGVVVENVKLSANYVDVFAKLMKLKEVALVTELTGELAEGYGAEIDVPDTITIKGSEKDIKDIESITTEPVDISGMTEGGTISLKAILPDRVELANGYKNVKAGLTIQPISNKEIVYSVEEILLEGLTKGKSVNTEIETLEVLVSGKVGIVNKLNKDDLELYVDVSDLEVGDHTVQVMALYDVPLHSITVNPEQIAISIIEIEQEKIDE